MTATQTGQVGLLKNKRMLGHVSKEQQCYGELTDKTIITGLESDWFKSFTGSVQYIYKSIHDSFAVLVLGSNELNCPVTGLRYTESIHSTHWKERTPGVNSLMSYSSIHSSVRWIGAVCCFPNSEYRFNDSRFARIRTLNSVLRFSNVWRIGSPRWTLDGSADASVQHR
jgi:hypothetical protein